MLFMYFTKKSTISWKSWWGIKFGSLVIHQFYYLYITVSVDSISRDGPDTPIIILVCNALQNANRLDIVTF